MTAAAELLAKFNIHLQQTAPGRYYTTCPRCSVQRSKEHRKARCLGVTIDERGACWSCFHCGWTGPEKGIGNGRTGDTTSPRSMTIPTSMVWFASRKCAINPAAV